MAETNPVPQLIQFSNFLYTTAQGGSALYVAEMNIVTKAAVVSVAALDSGKEIFGNVVSVGLSCATVASATLVTANEIMIKLTELGTIGGTVTELGTGTISGTISLLVVGA